jgi:hypothetical protein
MAADTHWPMLQEEIKMNGRNTVIVAATVAVLAVVSGVAISAQDRFTVTLPDGVPLL